MDRVTPRDVRRHAVVTRSTPSASKSVMTLLKPIGNRASLSEMRMVAVAAAAKNDSKATSSNQ